MISALVMTVSTAPSARVDLALAHAVADHLAAAELHLLAVGGRSFSTSTISSVSARCTRSPVVGLNMSA